MFVEYMITDDLKLWLPCLEVLCRCMSVLKEFIESVQSIQNITYKLCKYVQYVHMKEGKAWKVYESRCGTVETRE
jgi:hypothetical protein